MNFGKAFFWKLGIAGTALLLAIAVYCLARIYPPDLLSPFQSTAPKLAEQTALFGSAPSFFYTLAICLIFSTCAVTRSSAILHCITWLGLALLLEISQHQLLAQPLTLWLMDTQYASVREMIGPYWERGVFDPLDLIATIAGALAALTVLACFPTVPKDESSGR